MVHGHSHVAMPLLVAGLVHAQPVQALEPRAALRPLQVGPDAPADAAHGVPAHVHKLGHDGHAAVAGEPGRLVLEELAERRVALACGTASQTTPCPGQRTRTTSASTQHSARPRSGARQRLLPAPS